MKFRMAVVLTLAASLALAGLALAGEGKTVTFEGAMMCAHCTLKEAGLKECQDVVQVKGEKGTTNYYVKANDVAKKFGHACSGSKDVKITGTVMEKDGKMWIDAQKIEAVKPA